VKNHPKSSPKSHLCPFPITTYVICEVVPCFWLLLCSSGARKLEWCDFS
jgi:hypothetical protein